MVNLSFPYKGRGGKGGGREGGGGPIQAPTSSIRKRALFAPAVAACRYISLRSKDWQAAELIYSPGKEYIVCLLMLQHVLMCIRSYCNFLLMLTLAKA